MAKTPQAPFADLPDIAQNVRDYQNRMAKPEQIHGRGSLPNSRFSNIYLTEFRKTRMFQEKDTRGLRTILQTLASYEGEAAAHAHKVMLRWYHMVIDAALTAAYEVDSI